MANIQDVNQLKNHTVYEIQDLSLSKNQLCFIVIGEKNVDSHFLSLLPEQKTNDELLLQEDELFVNGQYCCRFTEVERQTFCYLSEQRGRAVSRDELYQFLYQGVREPFCRRIDNLISAMRKKVEKNQLTPELIITVRHKGYMLK